MNAPQLPSRVWMQCWHRIYATAAEASSSSSSTRRCFDDSPPRQVAQPRQTTMSVKGRPPDSYMKNPIAMCVLPRVKQCCSGVLSSVHAQCNVFPSAMKASARRRKRWL